MTVAMELATALHHSAQRVEAPREGVEGETNDAPRRPKPPLPGKRPGVLLDPEPVQVVDAVTSYVAAPGPSSLVAAACGKRRSRQCYPQVSRGSRVAGPKGAGGRAEKERGGGEEAEEGLPGTAHG